jgi:hypothetical protein
LVNVYRHNRIILYADIFVRAVFTDYFDFRGQNVVA